MVRQERYDRTRRRHEAALVDLALTLRDIDVKELKALGNASAYTALQYSVRNSSGECFLCFDSGKPLCAYGITDSIGEYGRMIWFLSSDAIDLHKREFMQGSRKVLEDWQAQYGALFNLVMEENNKSIRWLKWLGARFYEPKPIGMNGENYMLFILGGDGKCVE